MALFRKPILFCFVFLVALESFQLLSDSTAITSFISNRVFKNNFHTVVKDRFYRSAEMSNPDLKETVKRYKIKTVIDLRRGIDEGDSQGITASQALSEVGARYIHVPLNGSQLPSKDDLLALLDAFDNAETPVLAHCTSGSHRSALASSLWLLEKENTAFPRAASQFSFRFGYLWLERRFKEWWQGFDTIDDVFWTYKEEAKGRSFRQWVEESWNVKPGELVRPQQLARQ